MPDFSEPAAHFLSIVLIAKDIQKVSKKVFVFVFCFFIFSSCFCFHFWKQNIQSMVAQQLKFTSYSILFFYSHFHPIYPILIQKHLLCFTSVITELDFVCIFLQHKQIELRNPVPGFFLIQLKLLNVIKLAKLQITIKFFLMSKICHYNLLRGPHLMGSWIIVSIS